MSGSDTGCLTGFSTDDLIRVASSGGGLRLQAAYGTDALIRIASAAAGKGARVTIVNASGLGLAALIRIGSAGKGCVSFEG